MPKRIDLSTVSPERAAKLLANRAAKKREYERRKDVIAARNKAWQAENPEKNKAVRDAWVAANPERKAATRRADYDRNRERRLRAQALRHANLNDATVRSAVAHGYGAKAMGLTCADVPDEVLPLFRTQMLINRELRKQKAAS